MGSIGLTNKRRSKTSSSNFDTSEVALGLAQRVLRAPGPINISSAVFRFRKYDIKILSRKCAYAFQ